MNQITERLANLSIPTVLITIVVLLILRFVLLKLRTPHTKWIAELAESLAVAMFLVYLIIRPFIVQAFFIPSESMLPTLRVHDHILVNKFIYRFGEPKGGDVVVFKAPPWADPTQPGEKDFIKRVIAVPGDIVRITPGYVMVGENQYSHNDMRRQLSSLADSGEVKVRLMNGEVFANGRRVSKEEIAAGMGYPDAKVKVVVGKVFINGKEIKEPYIAEDPNDPYPGGPRASVKEEWLVTGKDGVKSVKIPQGRLLMMGDNRNESNDARYWGLLDRRRVLGKAMFIFWPLTRIRWVH